MRFGKVDKLPQLRHPSEAPFFGNACRVHPLVPCDLFVSGFDTTKASLRIHQAAEDGIAIDNEP